MHAENPAGGGAPGISVSALQPFAILIIRSYHRFGTSLPILIGIKRQDGKPWRGAFRTGKWIRRALRPGPACRKPARRRFFAPRTRLPSRPVRNGHERQPSPKAPARQASERAWRAMRQPSLKLRLERFHNECGRERERVEILSARSRSQLRSHSRLQRKLNCSRQASEWTRVPDSRHSAGISRDRIWLHE